MTCKGRKDRPEFSVHQQCPEDTKQVNILYLSLPIKKHIFGMIYLLWHRPHFSLINN